MSGDAGALNLWEYQARRPLSAIAQARRPFLKARSNQKTQLFHSPSHYKLSQLDGYQGVYTLLPNLK